MSLCSLCALQLTTRTHLLFPFRSFVFVCVLWPTHFCFWCPLYLIPSVASLCVDIVCTLLKRTSCFVWMEWAICSRPYGCARTVILACVNAINAFIFGMLWAYFRCYATLCDNAGSIRSIEISLYIWALGVRFFDCMLTWSCICTSCLFSWYDHTHIHVLM